MTWEHLNDLDGATLTITTTTGQTITGPISSYPNRPGIVTVSPDNHEWIDIALEHIVTVEWKDV